MADREKGGWLPGIIPRHEPDSEIEQIDSRVDIFLVEPELSRFNSRRTDCEKCPDCPGCPDQFEDYLS